MMRLSNWDSKEEGHIGKVLKYEINRSWCLVGGIGEV